MSYRRRASALHAARAGVGIGYCAALATVALVCDNPLLLGAALVAVLAAGLAAGVRRELRGAARLGLGVAVLIALLNPLVDDNGATVLARLGELPLVGYRDVTLEAVAYGAVFGLRALVLILCFALYSAAVDPDEVLRLFRRVSFRSALSATLATRMVPVLRRDAARLAEAQRCRPAPPHGAAARVGIVRAVAAGSLERAVDVAAALEVRGYAAARRPPRSRRAWSRHDLALAAAAVALVALAVGGRVAGLAGFDAYPRVHVAAGPGTIALAAAVVLVALAPFADRRGIVR